MKVLNVTYDYSMYYGMMNATMSENGAASLFLKPSRDLNNVFATVVLNFSPDGSANFNANFINKTIDFCKLLHVPRYEPLIKLTYKIISETENVHFPQRCPLKKVFVVS